MDNESDVHHCSLWVADAEIWTLPVLRELLLWQQRKVKGHVGGPWTTSWHSEGRQGNKPSPCRPMWFSHSGRHSLLPSCSWVYQGEIRLLMTIEVSPPPVECPIMFIISDTNYKNRLKEWYIVVLRYFKSKQWFETNIMYAQHSIY